MALAWVFNLDAEFELARKAYTPPRLLQDHLARHGAAARALMGPEDVEIGADSTPRLARGRAWCPTPRALQLMAQAGVTPEPHPAREVLREVNHRLFAHRLGGGLQGQRYVRTRAELARSYPLLLKRPLAFAGRGQLRLSGPPDHKQEEWIAASLAKDGLIEEPLVTISCEFTQHGFLWRDGRRDFGVPCVQETNARGVFVQLRRATSVDLSASEAALMQATLSHVADALFAAAYFGPFGIDAYRHPDGFCALSEINARFTMGFALGMRTPAHQLVL